MFIRKLSIIQTSSFLLIYNLKFLLFMDYLAAQIFRNGGICGKGGGMIFRVVSTGWLPNPGNKASFMLCSSASWGVGGGCRQLGPTGMYTLGTQFKVGLLINNGTMKVFLNDMINPIFSGPLVVTCDTAVFKIGNYYALDPTYIAPTTPTGWSPLQLFSLDVL